MADTAERAFKDIVDRHERGFRTLGDMTYEVIRESILEGVFAPGEHLRQDRLAEAIGVSRIPVRSALMQLEAEGLLTFHPHRGAVVKRLSAEEMREIYEIRIVLETYALRKAMRAMTAERIDHLDKLARDLNKVTDGAEFLAGRLEFFRELYDGENHPHLMGAIESLRTSAGRYWLHRRVEYVRGPGHRDHGEVLEFLREGDVEGAVGWLRAHLERVCEELVALMEADERERA